MQTLHYSKIATKTKTVAIVQEKILQILAEFRNAGIPKIPKDRLCELTGYKSTATKTWATAFKNIKNAESIRIGSSNSEMMVELNHLPNRMTTEGTPPIMRDPNKIKVLFNKYSKALKIRQTTNDVFDVLLLLGCGRSINKADLAIAVNKNIATKSFTDALKLFKSFGLFDNCGNGRGNSSYRFLQSLFVRNDDTADTGAEIETKTGAVPVAEEEEEIPEEGFTCQETDAPDFFLPEEAPYAAENIVVPLGGQNLIYHQDQQHQIAETLVEPGAPLALQMAGEDAGNEVQVEELKDKINLSQMANLENVISI